MLKKITTITALGFSFLLYACSPAGCKNVELPIDTAHSTTFDVLESSDIDPKQITITAPGAKNWDQRIHTTLQAAKEEINNNGILYGSVNLVLPNVKGNPHIIGQVNFDFRQSKRKLYIAAQSQNAAKNAKMIPFIIRTDQWSCN